MIGIGGPIAPAERLRNHRSIFLARQDRLVFAALLALKTIFLPAAVLFLAFDALLSLAAGKGTARLREALATGALATAFVFVCLATLPVAGSALRTSGGVDLGLWACLVGGVVAGPAAFAAAAWVASRV